MHIKAVYPAWNPLFKKLSVTETAEHGNHSRAGQAEVKNEVGLLSSPGHGLEID